MLTTSANGRKLIESFEGCRLEAYQDQRGIWTIGYGSTQGVKQGDVITHAQADDKLAADLQTAEHTVNYGVHVPLNQNQFDALVSLTFNIGSGNFLHSELRDLLNSGQYLGAANQFLAWDKTGGQINAGLLRRRNAERALFVEIV